MANNQLPDDVEGERYVQLGRDSELRSPKVWHGQDRQTDKSETRTTQTDRRTDGRTSPKKGKTPNNKSVKKKRRHAKRKEEKNRRIYSKAMDP